MASDLNVSPLSDDFRDFAKAGKLRDGRRGHGILPTWPTLAPMQV